MHKILIIDDDRTTRLAIKEVMDLNGFLPIDASGGRDGIEVFKRENPDAVILDLKMPDMDGIETMQELKKIDHVIPVIMLSGHGNIPTAVESIKQGAYDFIVKPPYFDRLLIVIKRAIEKASLEKEVLKLNTVIDTSIEGLLGKNEEIKKVIKQIHRIASSDFSVIIQGETGTGKTMAARAIHDQSRRRDKPFITVDIGAIPDTLIESELFGYEKGAFTGAEKKRKGFFEIANGGTIFIDELQNMPSVMQGKLLGAVEKKQIYPLGAARPLDIDVRIIAATNVNVRQALKEGHLREDLFFRLSEFIISLPPLRERVEDISLLAYRFLNDSFDELNKQFREITPEAMNLLKQYPWSGNVRELKNVCRRAAIMCDNGTIRPSHLEFLIEDKNEYKDTRPIMPLKELSAAVVRDAEKKAIKKAMYTANGNKTKTASILQIDYKTLLTKIKEYGI
ncbi:MAG: sigma-54-dependent Fis family transcriptional regulator [Deltaproteobacteria bacterium]|nr:sigma-54-dependent Fis family transcriptional regulator [Deltaproteobacteria bacterium]